MRYEKFRGLNRLTSMLGFGAMRLLEKEPGQLDEELSIELIRHAIDNGINYIDTAYPYGDGRSEVVVGRALQDGYRRKVVLADKFPIWLAKTEEDVDRIFNEQLERLGQKEEGCIDMYLIHALNAERWETCKQVNMMGYLEKQKAAGKIGNIGFSFHDDISVFREIIDAYPWDFCLIQLNYMDVKHQAGLAGLEYAREKGIDVIIMEPLKGGRISDSVPESVQWFWDRAKLEGVMEEERTPAQTAFKWVASQPGVRLILSGMNTREQIDENIRIFSQLDVASMSQEEYEVVDKVAAEYNRLFRYKCTGCNYCMPCPNTLEIPKIISHINNWYAFNKHASILEQYDNWMAPESHASKCVECGKCEEHCPQNLKIMEIMKDAAEQFGS